MVCTIACATLAALATASLSATAVGAAFAALAALSAGCWAVLRIGMAATAAVSSLLLTSFSGFLERITPAAGVAGQVGVVTLTATALTVGTRLRLPRSVVIPGALFMLLSTIWAAATVLVSPQFTMRGWLALVFPVVATLAFAGVVTPRSQEDVPRADRATRAILMSLGLVIAAAIAWAVRQSLTGLTPAEVAQAVASQSTYEAGEFIRLPSIFATNQDFGLFLAGTSPAALALGLMSTGRARTACLAVSGTLYLVTLLTFTRTALIAGTVAGLGALLWWGGRSVIRRVGTLVLIVSSTLAAVFGLLSVTHIPRLEAALERAATLANLATDESYNARLDATLPRSIEAAVQHPLGAGLGASGPISQQFPAEAPLGVLTTDNGYLMVAVQIGFLGAAFFIGMLLATVLFLGRSADRTSKAGAACLLSLLVAMLTAQYWSLSAPMTTVAAIVGVAASRHAKAAFGHTNEAPSRLEADSCPRAHENTQASLP
ncbi:O-antigen ligase family protein [Geodermatophilus sp. SYSU D00965]